MKKTTTLGILCIILCAASASTAATVTSVTNGNWLTPTTWDCNCIPQPTDDIVIAHNVTLNTDWSINGASLTVDPGASLREDAQIRNFGMNGGTVINNGVIDISRMALLNCSVTNNDSIYAQAIYNTGTIANGGDIFGVDSIFNDGTMQNLSIGTMDGIYFTNAGQYQNSGDISVYNFLQTGDFTNDGNIDVSNDFGNTGIFHNNSSMYVGVDGANTGKFNNNGSATVTFMSDFINDDSLTTKTARITNDGLFEVWVDMANMDSLAGSGTYCIGQYSGNDGVMTGNFDFCDKTPPQNPPYIDVNTGTIDTNITWCANSLCLPVAAETLEEERGLLLLYPNPSGGTVQLQAPAGQSLTGLYIRDLAGTLLLHIPLNRSEKTTIDLSALAAGSYLYHCASGSGRQYNGMLNIVH